MAPPDTAPVADPADQRRLDVLIFLEATRFNGPLVNLVYALDLLRESHIRVRFVQFYRSADPVTDFERGLTERGYEIIQIPERHSFDPAAWLKVRQVLERERPDIIQVDNTKSRFFVTTAQWSRLRSLRNTVFVFHGETWTDRKQALYNQIDRRLLRLGAAVVAVAPKQAEFLRSWGVPSERIHVIRNAIPETPPRALEAPDPSPLHFVTAGRFSDEKAQDLLIEAFAELIAERGSAARLTLYGEGPDLESVRQRAQTLGLGELVEFPGYCRDVARIYADADAFVLPSRSEGLPNVLLEAAMAGVPIIATEVGGVPDFLEHGRLGRLVPPESTAALKTAMAQRIDDPDPFRALAGAARATVLANYSPRSKAEQMLRCYESLTPSG
ncbi:MAG: glycosyltransferase [Pseudomonadota bacterium]